MNVAEASPRLSIVVINYNYSAFLRQAIDSALDQAPHACEVVVVDDASTDGSLDIIRSYGSRIIAVFRPVNGGMSAAVNTGFARATGDIVLFLDADDFLYSDAADRIRADWSPEVAQCQARLDLIDASGQREDIYPAPEVAFDQGDVTSLLLSRGRYSTTVTSGLAFSRASLEAVMPIPERAFDRSADGYLATVVPLFGRVITVEQTIGAYRRHDSNHSGFGADIAKRARWRVEHDEHRYTALREHAKRCGVAMADNPGMHDGVHLEQRLASLCFEPDVHPYAKDSRVLLALAGARAAFTAPMSAKRRVTYAAMFLAAGFSPHFVACPALAWKLERSSRPAIIDKVAARLRKLMG